MQNISIQGADEVQAKLGRLESGLIDLQPAFEDMADTIVQEFKANFPAKGTLLGEEWPPRKRKYAWPILIKTGTLQGNWENKAEPRKLEIKNPTDYAKYHHFGSVYLPVRRLVGPSTNIIQIAKDRITAYIKKFFN